MISRHRAPQSLPAIVLLFAATLLLTVASGAEAALYWANQGSTIGRANLDGSGANQSFITGGDRPCGVAADGSHVYWANSNADTIGRANLDGSGAEQSFITGADFPCGVAVDHSHVYWADQFGNTIGRANLDGSGANHSFITGADLPCGVAVDGGHVYWANGGGTTIGSANLDGSGADQSFTAAKFPCGVAVSGSHIYWANYGLDVSGTTIGRAKLNGSDADQRFITGASDPCGVAVDGSHIYWANQTDNAIGRAKLNGRGVDQRFARANFPCGVAVDPFSFGKVTKDEKRGTAQLTVSIPGPGGLELAATEKLKGAAKRAEAAGEVKLPIKPKANAKRTLRKRGEAKVNVDVTYTPDGGEPRTESTSLRLVKR